MGLMPGRGETAIDLMNRLLDRGYVQASGAVLQAITRNSTTGLMARRFEELEREAARLAAEGARLTLDNAVVRAFMADFEDTMRANQALLNSAAGAVQQTGIDAAGPIARQMALPGFTDEMLRAMGIAWNVPNPEAVARLVNYASSDAWVGLVGKYGDDAVAMVRSMAVRGALEGWGPVRTAREMRRMVEGIPPNTANTLMRTLQLTSLRDAQTVHRVANADILEYQIRIAALDDRTCVACIALHGTVMELGERVDDHHNGRCTSITKIRGWAAPDVQSGPDWFRQLPEAKQREHMSAAAWEAWNAGKVRLDDFAQRTVDDVFGGMIQEASLKGILGSGAREFYGVG